MISFIIIGRNEGWKLSICINSVVETVLFNRLSNYEILYVDSNSTDDSIQIARKFKNIKILKLTKDCNPAIARNTGANEAIGNVLFFLDGDMELNKRVFIDLFNEKMNLKYDFISGDFQNYYYSDKISKKVIYKEMYHKNNKITKNFTTGGLFVIRKDKWDKVGGMRNIFKKSEDTDFGLRLSKKGIYMYRLPINLVNHHTINYKSDKRLWADLFDSSFLYGRSLLYRNNVLNWNTFRLMIGQDYSFIVLFFVVLLSILFWNYKIMSVYIIVVILRTLLKRDSKYLIYFIIRDVKVLLGFFFFSPKKNIVSYNVIR